MTYLHLTVILDPATLAAYDRPMVNAYYGHDTDRTRHAAELSRKDRS